MTALVVAETASDLWQPQQPLTASPACQLNSK